MLILQAPNLIPNYPHQSNPNQSSLSQSNLSQSNLSQSNLSQSNLSQSSLNQSNLNQSLNILAITMWLSRVITPVVSSKRGRWCPPCTLYNVI
ncbi:pentapeptide repeat-containing protein [Plesiomonas shigelloides]|uniref:pentapeptide repeat-containing protein n=1 Tax=Plesiomonas shigelloides TaxID=703 RepID=UPI00387F16C5